MKKTLNHNGYLQFKMNFTAAALSLILYTFSEKVHNMLLLPLLQPHGCSYAI